MNKKYMFCKLIKTLGGGESGIFENALLLSENN
jgi:hypothetical protein